MVVPPWSEEILPWLMKLGFLGPPPITLMATQASEPEYNYTEVTLKIWFLSPQHGLFSPPESLVFLMSTDS